MAFPHIYVEQEIAHVGMALTHGAIDIPTGSLLWASFEQAQLKVGLGIPFLDSEFDLLDFLLADCLWKAIWKFTSTYGIRLVFHRQVLPYRRHVNDVFIMEALSYCKELTEADLISCNRCCLALEAVTLADITTGDGQCIWRDCLGAELSLSQRSKWEFPVERPSSWDPDSWVKDLKFLSSPTLIIAAPYRLKE
jgi:hypothetical protein